MNRMNCTTTAKTPATRTNGTARNAGSRAKACRLLLGLGVFGIAGLFMNAAPAMANDRGDDRGQFVDRHDDRPATNDRRDFDDHRNFDGDHDRMWVADRNELRHDDRARTIDRHVVIDAVHRDYR